jgi:cell division protein FtsL
MQMEEANSEASTPLQENDASRFKALEKLEAVFFSSLLICFLLLQLQLFKMN